ncbi:MAG: FecR domain-containing protein [Ginsengibacter sp.]
MSDIETRLQYLYLRFIQDEASVDEIHEFWELMRLSDNADPIKESVFALYEDKIPEGIEEKNWAGSFRKILDQPKKEALKKYNWMVAASVVFILGAFGYLYIGNNTELAEGVSVKVEKPEFNDIAPPTSNRATITLPNGEKVFLDSLETNGVLTMMNQAELTKTGDGEIIYNATNTQVNGELIYNTLTNPRGSKVISIVLSDGSSVWLNSGSTLTYPVAFSGRERKVTVIGEAYFQVKSDPARKFIVTANDVSTEVFGTEFNVNAYHDEDAIRITLLHGSIKVAIADGQSAMVKPGEQASKVSAGKLNIHRDINVDNVIAWKNEMFSFQETNIKEIMKEVSRWYDVDIEYSGDFGGLNFGGNMSRQSHVSELLKRLEATKAVKFKVNGNKITVIQIQ